MTRSSRTVIRPKSIATVVVSLPSTPSRASTSTLGALITSSVRSGLISLTEETSVVLPAPKPPAMRILIDTGSATAGSESESSKGISDILEHLRVSQSAPSRPADCDQPVFAHVGEQDPDDAKREVEVGGQIGDRLWRPALTHDGQELRFEHELVDRDLGRADEREQVDGFAGRPRATTGQRVRADDRTLVPVEPLIVAHGWSHRLSGACGWSRVHFHV